MGYQQKRQLEVACFFQYPFARFSIVIVDILFNILYDLYFTTVLFSKYCLQNANGGSCVSARIT